MEKFSKFSNMHNQKKFPVCMDFIFHKLELCRDYSNLSSFQYFTFLLTLYLSLPLPGGSRCKMMKPLMLRGRESLPSVLSTSMSCFWLVIYHSIVGTLPRLSQTWERTCPITSCFTPVVVKKRFLGHHQKSEKVPLKSAQMNKF